MAYDNTSIMPVTVSEFVQRCEGNFSMTFYIVSSPPGCWGVLHRTTIPMGEPYCLPHRAKSPHGYGMKCLA